MTVEHTTRSRHARRVVVALVVLLTAGAIVGAGIAASGESSKEQQQQSTLTFDIAENGKRFVYDAEPVFPEDGLPMYGNDFLTEGYIYKAGTLGAEDGVNADGSPQFPNKVIGKFTCYGYFTGDGAHTTEGAWVVTTQIFELQGGQTLTSNGFENPAGAGVAVRAVIGGTKRYAGAEGEQRQLTLGHNPSGGINAQISIALEDE